MSLQMSNLMSLVVVEKLGGVCGMASPTGEDHKEELEQAAAVAS